MWLEKINTNRWRRPGRLIRIASTCSAEVVDRGATDIDRSEVLLNPRRDLARGARLAGSRWALAITGDEVPHLPLGDVGLELRQSRRIVRARDPADRHDRSTGLELQTARGERADTGCRPTVIGTLYEIGQRCVVCL